ncbi:MULTISPECIES: bifunctional ornithine acetyltransferase/N-acetylglutamate synthase [unclassified Nocardiopsis]|uniref:bifunctional ornithine acetyltransferase/N-acetylglutamate synthase n=1 Tax=unclassified Nocardiopsis TaxID=2649073 RepID=UPI00135ACB3D|nr:MULTISPECIES: bifunctional ornithine acetyltransferase/N-acetylglutamate synthase [unclassified Nocardiopsis]
MSVTAPQGFRAAGVAAGLKDDGARDVAVVVNDGPSRAAGAVFTTAQDPAAPVLWSRQVVSGGRVRAAVLASGGANAGTGPRGFQDVHAQAEHTADLLEDSAAEIVLCASGPLDVRPPLDVLNKGVSAALAEASRGGGLAAADAIRTDDTVVKIAFRRGDGYTVGAMAKGPDPSVSSALCVLTTDADLTADQCQRLLAGAVEAALAPLTAANDTVLLLASGAAGTTPDEDDLAALLTEVLSELATQVSADTPDHDRAQNS